MKFCSVTTLPLSEAIPSLVKIGLVVLMFMPASFVVADNTPNTTAPAAAKPETTATNPVKPAPVTKPVSSIPVANVASNQTKTSSPSRLKAKPECVRTGQRVIAALAREDSGAASQFHTFYAAFSCSPAHLAQAFGCLVNLQTANPGLSNPTPEQVTECWDEPTVIPKIIKTPSDKPATSP